MSKWIGFGEHDPPANGYRKSIAIEPCKTNTKSDHQIDRHTVIPIPFFEIIHPPCCCITMYPPKVVLAG